MEYILGSRNTALVHKQLSSQSCWVSQSPGGTPVLWVHPVFCLQHGPFGACSTVRHKELWLGVWHACMQTQVLFLTVLSFAYLISVNLSVALCKMWGLRPALQGQREDERWLSVCRVCLCLYACVVVQPLSHVQLFVTPWTAANPASLSFTISWSLLKLMAIESVMSSNHLILCCPLLLLPSILPSIRVYSNESALCIRWPKHWSFRFSSSPSNEYSGLRSFRIDWFDLLAI